MNETGKLAKKYELLFYFAQKPINWEFNALGDAFVSMVNTNISKTINSSAFGLLSIGADADRMTGTLSIFPYFTETSYKNNRLFLETTLAPIVGGRVTLKEFTTSTPFLRLDGHIPKETKSSIIQTSYITSTKTNKTLLSQIEYDAVIETIQTATVFTTPLKRTTTNIWNFRDLYTSITSNTQLYGGNFISLASTNMIRKEAFPIERVMTIFSKFDGYGKQGVSSASSSIMKLHSVPLKTTTFSTIFSKFDTFNDNGVSFISSTNIQR